MGNLCCNDTIVLPASRRPNVCYMGMIIDIVLKLGQVDHAVFAFSQQKEDFGKKGDCFMGIGRDCSCWVSFDLLQPLLRLGPRCQMGT